MERKTAFFAAGAIAVIGIIALAFSHFSGPAPALPHEADLSLRQYPEQPGSALSPVAPSAPPPVASAQPAPVLGCGLRFSFVPDMKAIAPGDSITYAATLANQGTDPCENASFSVYYADAETFSSANPAATASGYYWSVGTLAPGASYAVSIATVENAGSGVSEIDNEACATADNSTDVCADNVIFVGTRAALEKSAAAPLPAGGAWGAAFAAKEFGTWIWDYPDQMTEAYERQAVSAAAENGFNAIYLTIDDYLAIAALPDGAEKQAKRSAYFDSLARFVAIAKEKGIAVDVEGGANDWGEPENRWKGYALIDFTQAYNAAYPDAKVRGLQFDVESYLSSGYESDEAGTLQSFVDFIDAAAGRMQKENPDARFSIVIPHFYDATIAWTPTVSHQGKREYTFDALLDALEQKPGSALIVMAYRNFFAGDNGTEEIAAAEVNGASARHAATKIVVAQETGNVPPAYVTFYGLSKADLYEALSDIESAFGSSSNFGGVAVHYLDPFLKLR